MLPFVIAALSNGAMAGLKKQQDKVDAQTTHASRYEKASALFSAKSPPSAFKEAKATLRAESPAGDACYYCERDRYRDIEHVRPKRHYPESAFDWFNYVYACVVCNQDAKKDTFAVFTGETEYVQFNRSHPIDDPVPAGPPVLIDPRSENPLEFLQLDFDTGSFVATDVNPRATVRGEYTRDLFDLDSADLTRIRRNYVGFYLQRCEEYVAAKAAGEDQRADLVLEDILEMEHPTVIVELRRQAPSIPKLAKLFAELPQSVGSWPKGSKKTAGASLTV